MAELIKIACNVSTFTVSM